MKKTILSIFVLFLSCVNFAFAQAPIPSNIKEVTLFSNQALVKREAAAEVKSGVNEIILEIEAYNVDQDSVFAKVFGEGELFSVQFKEVFLEEAPQENIKALENKLEELGNNRKALLNQRSLLGKKEKFLDSLVDFSKTQVPEDIKTSLPKTPDLEQILLFLDKNQAEINKGAESIDIEIRKIDKEMDVVERELESLRSYAGKSRKEIEIVFDSKKDQKIRIEASYLVFNASWDPLYKVDVAPDLKEVNMTMFSKIVQRTGENWDNMKLSISNVIPLRGAALPGLESWYIDVERYEHLDKEYSVAIPMAGAVMKQRMLSRGDLKEEAAVPEEEAVFAQAQRKELPLSFEYELPQAISIESKDKEAILPLFSKSINGEFFNFSVPQISPLTFLVCKASSDKELLSGNLNVYFGGRFVGKTFLGEKKPGEDFNISLGADREVKVKREKIRDKVEEMFFGKIERNTIIRDMAFKITIENLKEKPIKIKLLDSVPVSKTDKIVVKDVKITPEPAKRDYEDKEGVMLWEYSLAAKEKKEVSIEFIVTYPKDSPIFGL